MPKAKLAQIIKRTATKHKPIVLLHGLGNNHRSWHFVTEKLQKIPLDIYALDLLGFGDAPKPMTSQYDLEAHADAVIEFLDDQALTGCVLAGHSMGCLVAIHIAYKRPDLVTRLLLLGPPLYDVLPRSRKSTSGWFRRKIGLYFSLFEYLRDHPKLTTQAADFIDEFMPMVKGMEITEETWPAFSRSLEHTIMTTQPYRELTGLEVPALCYYGLLDVFILRRPITKAHRKNRRFVKYRIVLGPHEITPLQGRKIAKVLARLAS